MAKKKRILKIILFVLAVLLLMAAIPAGYILMLSTALTGGDIPHKSDEELIANFHSHRPEFGRLLQMINEDQRLLRVDDSWTFPENPQAIGVSQERIEEYRRLFRRAGVPRGFSAFQTRDFIEFMASAQGLVVSGSSKGYLYATEPPPRLVEDLDSYKSQQRRFSTDYPVYRHIEGNWYLFFDAH